MYNQNCKKNKSQFIQLSSMPFHKLDFQVCILKDNIYVIGGKDVNGSIVNSMEIYSIKNNLWSILSPCQYSRFAGCAIAVHTRDIIILVGG